MDYIKIDERKIKVEHVLNKQETLDELNKLFS